MSKMDGLRAMREAKYAATGRAAGPAPRAVSRPASADVPVAPAAATTPDPDPRLCGHRNMGGRSCTREHGHTAKSHRYS